MIGTLLDGRFRLERKLGSGGMSTVYRAFDETLERWVAIKVMHRDITSDAAQIERLRRFLSNRTADLSVEIQQRAVEYTNLFGYDQIRRGVLERMPAPEIREEQRVLGAPTKKRQSKVKAGAYECGMEPIGDARGRFSVRFYMVAMLFILFDVEAVFMLPWAVIFRQLHGITGSRLFGFWEMLVYLGFVAVGLFYVWKKGILDWSNDRADL